MYIVNCSEGLSHHAHQLLGQQHLFGFGETDRFVSLVLPPFHHSPSSLRLSAPVLVEA